MRSLDEPDRKILRQLQRDSRRSISDIADICGVSKSVCHRRIQSLQEIGIIERYTVTLSAEGLGIALMFFVEVRLKEQSTKEMAIFERAIAQMPEVLECQLMSGESDYVLRVASKSTSHYETFHQRLVQLSGVAKVTSSLALRTVKPWSGLPV